MAEEVQIPICIWPHPSNNANGLATTLDMTNDLHTPFVWQLPTATAVDYCAALALPIPSWINGTPAGKIYLRWCTGSTDTTSSIKFFVKVNDKLAGTDSLDHAAWDDELTVLDTSAGQWVANECSVSLSSTSQVSGRGLSILIRRDDPGDAADTLNVVCYLLEARYVADKA